MATPIGNLGDITLRALETLAACDVIACEDTRTSGVLLKRYGIATSKVSYTEHNAAQRGEELVSRIEAGEAVALISDAGTPLVSDPGFRLVKEVVAKGLPVTTVPGASAPLSALPGSGLDNSAFQFAGFLPGKALARRAALAQHADQAATMIYFESPARIVATLADAVSAIGADRDACIARELTKMHETFHRGTLAALHEEFAAMDRVRGEIVLLIGGADNRETSMEDAEQLLIEALSTMKPGQAASLIARQTGLSRQDLYRKALSLKD